MKTLADRLVKKDSLDRVTLQSPHTREDDSTSPENSSFERTNDVFDFGFRSHRRFNHFFLIRRCC